MKTFEISGREVYFVRSTYTVTGGHYIGIKVSEDDSECPGEWWTDATVCISEVELQDDEVVIPVYKLTDETFSVIHRELLQGVSGYVQHDYGLSLLARLKPNWKEITEEMT